jgi:hypothetical protein
VSRASDLRDGIVTELSNLLAVPVRAFVVVDWAREELLSGPQVGVRHSSRTFGIDMGPDTRTVNIQIAVVGVAPEFAGYETKQDDYRDAQLAKCDEYDGIVEQAMALWTPEGTLSHLGVADHRFNNMTQDQAFDSAHYYENGLWFGAFEVEYIDTIDEV